MIHGVPVKTYNALQNHIIVLLLMSNTLHILEVLLFFDISCLVVLK